MYAEYLNLFKSIFQNSILRWCSSCRIVVIKKLPKKWLDGMALIIYNGNDVLLPQEKEVYTR